MTQDRILITGASGQLGSYLLRAAHDAGMQVVAWSHQTSGSAFGYPFQPVDLNDADAVGRAFGAARPSVVIHAAALSRIGDCYQNPEAARRTNTTATRMLAELAARHSARMIYLSTDLVFDGNKGWYTEDDCPAPLSVYGRTKADAERNVIAHPPHVVVRVSLLFGPSINGRDSFFSQQIDRFRRGETCTLFQDEWRTPLSLLTAARGLLLLARSNVAGILHLAGPERMSRLEMGIRLAELLGTDKSQIKAINRHDISTPEPRPRDTSLCCDLWQRHFPELERPSFETALREMGIESA